MFTVAKEITQIINYYKLGHSFLQEFIDNIALVDYNDSLQWKLTRRRLNFTRLNDSYPYTTSRSAINIELASK